LKHSKYHLLCQIYEKQWPKRLIVTKAQHKWEKRGENFKKCKIKFDERQYKIGVIRREKKSSLIAAAIIYRSFTFKK